MLNNAEIMEAHKETVESVIADATESKACASCVHWNEVSPCEVLIGKSGPIVDWDGECRKNPPTKKEHRNDWDPKSEFPITAYDCHCSQFEE